MGRKLKRRIESGELRGVRLVEHQWFNYYDKNGPGYCQTDFYLICPGYIILLECKLTQSHIAELQMYELYVPILKEIYNCPVICVQVFKNVKKRIPNRIEDITDLLLKPKTGLFNWHHM